MNYLIIGGEGTGKTTLAAAMAERHGHKVLAFGDEPRRYCAETLEWPEFYELSKDQKTKNAPLAKLDGMSPREYINFVSAFKKRDDPFIWMRKSAERAMAEYVMSRDIIFEDCRFIHELEMQDLLFPCVIIWLDIKRVCVEAREYNLPFMRNILEYTGSPMLKIYREDHENVGSMVDQIMRESGALKPTNAEVGMTKMMQRLERRKDLYRRVPYHGSPRS